MTKKLKLMPGFTEIFLRARPQSVLHAAPLGEGMTWRFSISASEEEDVKRRPNTQRCGFWSVGVTHALMDACACLFVGLVSHGVLCGLEPACVV